MIIRCKTLAWLQRVTLCATILMASWTQLAQAQANPHNSVEDSLKIKTFQVFFSTGSSVIDTSIMDNQVKLEELSKFFEEHKDVISHIDINASASPDGGVKLNMKLAHDRAQSIYSYLQTLPVLPNSPININNLGIGWDMLEELVKEKYFPHRSEVLYILQNVQEETWAKRNPSDRWISLVDSRNHQLMNLRGGRPYKYMLQYIFPKLRSVEVIDVYYKTDPTQANENESAENMVDTIAAQTDSIQTIDPRELVGGREQDGEGDVTQGQDGNQVQGRGVEPEQEREPKDLFAFKTNLLFDAISVVNAEIEVPIGNRWSIAGEFAFPWWTMDNHNAGSKRNRLQIYNGNIEGKYWFGDRTDRPKMTGWFAGLHFGGGIFDMEYDTKGYQSDLFLMGGLSGGYAHTINKKGNLRMEYSLGLGYMQTEYKYYESYYDESYVSPENPDSPYWHPVHQSTGRLKWFGPTKLKVSLVWMLNRNAKKKGSK